MVANSASICVMPNHPKFGIRSLMRSQFLSEFSHYVGSLETSCSTKANHQMG